LKEPPRQTRTSPGDADSEATPPVIAAESFFIAIGLAGIAFHGINFWTPYTLSEKFGLAIGYVGIRFGMIAIVAGSLGMLVLEPSQMWSKIGKERPASLAF
jgi:hypothetical protein